MDVRTARLRLRDLRPDDLPAMTELWIDPDVGRFMGDFGPRRAEDVERWLLATIAGERGPDRRSHNCAIVVHGSDDVAGWIGVGPSSRPIGDYDFGYAVRSGFRGRGYASEALAGVLRFCFDFAGVGSVWGECDGANLASARVMRRAGLDPIEPSPDGDLRFRAVADRWPERAEAGR